MNLLTRLDEKINDLRAIRLQITKPEFEILYNSLELGEQELLKAIVLSGRRSEFRKFILTKRDLETCGVAVLRRIASNLLIYNYSRMPKTELIKEIKNVQR